MTHPRFAAFHRRAAMCSLAFVLPAVCALSTHAGEVTVREVPMAIPTYLLESEDQNPAFHNADALGPQQAQAPVYDHRIYPYAMQTGVTDHKAEKTYQAVVLENDFIRLIILPELGGRIYAAHDKTNHDFDFIYHNHVIKPSLIALRGAWISGGIEWNFPTLGHTTNTFSPVAHRVVNGDDGSVTCVVGATEWVRRMKWSVAITVFPDRSCFRTRISLSNPTLTHNCAYFWANAAVHAWPDTRVVFPPTDHTFAGMRRKPDPWPINARGDVSWYKNTPIPYDFFCGTPGDYHGVYNVERDCGTIHTASSFASPGRKFFTWGTAPSGMIWEGLLTDADGQYLEIQSGRLPTQGDTWIFEPHMQEPWDEYWYPVRDMQGFVKANAEAAVNLSVQEGEAFVAVNATREHRDAEVCLRADGKEILKRKLTVGPRQPWHEKIPAAGKVAEWRLDLRDASGQPIIDYTTERKPIPKADLEPEFLAKKDASAEEIYLAGYYALKHWQVNQAERSFAAALEKDPGFTPALRMQSILRYQAGDFAKALELAQSVLARNEDDDTARYYSALARMKLGISEKTQDDLHLIGRRAAYRHVAPYLLASLAIEHRDLVQAEALLRRAVGQNPDDLRTRVMLAAVIRHAGHREEAESLLEQVLQDDPLHELAILERWLLQGKEGGVNLPGDDPQCWLEAACAYIEMNLLEDAAAVLQRCQDASDGPRHPFAAFYLGYLSDRAGRQDEARAHYERGLALSPKGVFPFRTESLDVLRTGLRYKPDCWQLHYYLGTLLTGKRRWQEGLDQFIAAEKLAPDFSVLYSNLGAIYWRQLGNLPEAERAFEKALACDPSDYHYYVALDTLYAETKDSAKRNRLFAAAPADVERDFRVRLRKAAYQFDEGQYDGALDLLANTTFVPWEGLTAVHDLYVQILNARAEKRMQAKSYDAAIQDLQLAMEYPKNLGVGRPHDPNFAQEFYRLGLCYQALGKKDLAEQYLTKAAACPHDSRWKDDAKKLLEQLGQTK